MQKNCPVCGAQKVLLESVDGGYKLTCESCGFSQVYNDDHKKLLVDERYSTAAPRRVLHG